MSPDDLAIEPPLEGEEEEGVPQEDLVEAEQPESDVSL